MTPALSQAEKTKQKIFPPISPSVLWHRLSCVVAAATSGPKIAECSGFFHPLMSMGPINISGKPTDQKWLLDSCPLGRKKKKSRGIFFFSSLKKRSQTSSLKREGHKKALKVKRIDEGAEERQKEKERGEENIAGGQLSGLFLEDCFSILQQGWREQGGSVWQLAPGGWRDRRMGIEKGRSESE